MKTSQNETRCWPSHAESSERVREPAICVAELSGANFITVRVGRLGTSTSMGLGNDDGGDNSDIHSQVSGCTATARAGAATTSA
jgi:hypothetical protein